jgi:nucleoside-diphosphate-sugar epimerase
LSSDIVPDRIMRIFLTGATGVIGRRVIPALVAAKHSITAVVRSPEKRAALATQGVSAIECDLFDPVAVSRAVDGHDTVINLVTSIPEGVRAMLVWAWKENSRIRKEVSANLSATAVVAGTARFIQESFAPVYPDGGDRWIDESVPLKPVAYNRTVLDAERAAARFEESGGTAVVLRFAWFYGPGDAFTETLFRSARRGWLPLPGDPEGYFSMVAHDDAARAVVAALDIPGGIYNVVEDEPKTRRQLGESLARTLGIKPPRQIPKWITLLEGSSGEMLLRSERISNRKLKSTGKWRPEAVSVEVLLATPARESA